MATFRQRDGRWQAIIRRVDLKATKTFDKKVDAQAWARALEREADLGGTMPKKMAGTLASLLDRYEREVWPIKRWGASKAQELKVIRRDLGAYLLSGIGQPMLMAYARKCAERLTGSGVGSRLSYLREALTTARDLWGLRVPVEAVDATISAARRQKIIGKSQARTRRATAAEIETLIAYFEKQTRSTIDMAMLVRILSILPLRVGELLGIQWDDLNEKRRTAVIRDRKHPDFREREGNDQEVPLIKFGGINTFDLVWKRERYMDSPFPYKRSSVSTAFGQACLHCKIDDLHIHDLRAHAVSSLLEAGIGIPLVALISGHRNWKVLAKNYARIDPASVHDAIKRLT